MCDQDWAGAAQPHLWGCLQEQSGEKEGGVIYRLGFALPQLEVGSRWIGAPPNPILAAQARQIPAHSFLLLPSSPSLPAVCTRAGSRGEGLGRGGWAGGNEWLLCSRQASASKLNFPSPAQQENTCWVGGEAEVSLTPWYFM